MGSEKTLSILDAEEHFLKCPDVIDLDKVHDECAKCPMYKGR